MKKRIAMAMIIMASLMCAKSVLALELSADIVTEVSGISAGASNKLFFSNNKMRIENESSDVLRKEITIVRPDMHITWLILPDRKIYAEQPFPGMVKLVVWPMSQKDIDDLKNGKTFIGNELVNGRSTKKYSSEVKIVGEGVRHNFVWIDDRTGWPIKSGGDYGTDFSLELKNFKEGVQPASLFELPDGYTKVSESELRKIQHIGAE